MSKANKAKMEIWFLLTLNNRFKTNRFKTNRFKTNRSKVVIDMTNLTLTSPFDDIN